MTELSHSPSVRPSLGRVCAAGQCTMCDALHPSGHVIGSPINSLSVPFRKGLDLDPCSTRWRHGNGGELCVGKVARATRGRLCRHDDRTLQSRVKHRADLDLIRAGCAPQDARISCRALIAFHRRAAGEDSIRRCREWRAGGTAGERYLKRDTRTRARQRGARLPGMRAGDREGDQGSKMSGAHLSKTITMKR
jgi:hypothetical protein